MKDGYLIQMKVVYGAKVRTRCFKGMNLLRPWMTNFFQRLGTRRFSGSNISIVSNTCENPEALRHLLK